MRLHRLRSCIDHIMRGRFWIGKSLILMGQKIGSREMRGNRTFGIQTHKSEPRDLIGHLRGESTNRTFAWKRDKWPYIVLWASMNQMSVFYVYGRKLRLCPMCPFCAEPHKMSGLILYERQLPIPAISAKLAETQGNDPLSGAKSLFASITRYPRRRGHCPRLRGFRGRCPVRAIRPFPPFPCASSHSMRRIAFAIP